MKICFVLGTRPEIIKLYPLIDHLKKNRMKFSIIHTGQHNLFSMEKVFFKKFQIKSKIYTKIEKILFPKLL